MVLEKKIFTVFTIYGHGGHLAWSSDTHQICKRSLPFCLEAAYETLIEIGSVVQRRNLLKMLADDGQRRLSSYKLHRSPWLRGAN